MSKISFSHVLLVSALTIALIGLTPVFAVSMPDSPFQTTSKNYAMITVGANCNDPGNGGDSDLDGICDNWESTTNLGLHINFTDSTGTRYVYNMACTPGNTIVNDPTGATVCPSPNKKDIYIELDWMTNQGPNPTAIADVVKAFDKMNIALHVVGGENFATNSGDMGIHYCFLHPTKVSNTLSPITNGQCTFSGSTAPSQSLALLKKNFFGTVAERNGDLTSCPLHFTPPGAGNAGPIQNSNSYNCLTAKRQVFHYMVVGNNLAINSGPGVDSLATAQSGWGEIPGNDVAITLGSFTNGVGSIDEQEGTIIHEIGHNLGLHHGGGTNPSGTTEDDNNCKPNYLSVMSYTYQFRKTGDECRPLAFSNVQLNTITETSPGVTDTNIDPNGLATYPTDNTNPPDNPNKSPACAQSGERKFVWSAPSGIKNSTNSVIDWNMNGQVDTTPVQQNVNKLVITGCNTNTNSTLSGFNDTAFIYGTTAPPLIFRTTAITNFQASIPAANDRDVDVAPGGEFTQNEQSNTLSITCPDGSVIPSTQQCPSVPTQQCPDGSIIPVTQQCITRPGEAEAWIVGGIVIGVIIAISIIIARRP